MELYRIRRLYRDSDASRVIRSGLTLEQAQAHCQNPETSSSTATGSVERARTRTRGPWFDSYESMRPRKVRPELRCLKCGALLEDENPLGLCESCTATRERGE